MNVSVRDIITLSEKVKSKPRRNSAGQNTGLYTSLAKYWSSQLRGGEHSSRFLRVRTLRKWGKRVDARAIGTTVVLGLIAGHHKPALGTAVFHTAPSFLV